MSAISQKSISGITSITSPAGTDDQISLHTSNTNEALKIDGAGNLHLNNHVNTTGVSTASNFKTGSSNLHSTGLNVGNTFVHSTGINGSSADIDDFISVGSNIHLGNAGVVTATSFVGSGAALTGIAATTNVRTNSLEVSGVSTFSGAINSSANITTTLDLNSRYLYVKDIFMEDVSPELRFIDSDNNPNYRIRLNSGLLGIRDITNNVDKLVFNTSGMVATGIVTATSFSGDGSTLTGVSGFATALSSNSSSLLNQIFKTNREASIGSGTVTIQSDAASGNMAFTRLNRINVVGSAVLHIGAGTTFKMNVLDLF